MFFCATQTTIRMKLVVFFVAVYIFALVMPQVYAEEKEKEEEEEAAIRVARGAKGVQLKM